MTRYPEVGATLGSASIPPVIRRPFHRPGLTCVTWARRTGKRDQPFGRRGHHCASPLYLDGNHLLHLRVQILGRLACQLPWGSAWPSAAERQVAGPADWHVVELGLFRRGGRGNREGTPAAQREPGWRRDSEDARQGPRAAEVTSGDAVESRGALFLGRLPFSANRM